jgi:hypothetical protein
MEAEVLSSAQQIRGGQQNNVAAAPDADAIALSSWSHTVSFENLQFSMWRPISARLHAK